MWKKVMVGGGCAVKGVGPARSGSFLGQKGDVTGKGANSLNLHCTNQSQTDHESYTT